MQLGEFDLALLGQQVVLADAGEIRANAIFVVAVDAILHHVEGPLFRKSTVVLPVFLLSPFDRQENALRDPLGPGGQSV